MATTLARAQLDPPPPHLTGALTTGIPVGTTLAVNAVPVENGRAQVTLSEQALDADPQQRTTMWAQLAATLSQVSAVQSVSITAGGTDLELPTLGTAVSVFADLGYTQSTTPSFETALLRAPADGRITRIDPRFIPDPSAKNRRPDTKEREGDPVRIPPVWVRLSMSVDGAEVAAVGDDLGDLSRWRGTEFIPVGSFATRLTRPAYDAKGWLWVGGQDRDGNGRLYVLDSSDTTEGRQPEPVDAPWLAERRVVAIALAADAARVGTRDSASPASSVPPMARRWRSASPCGWRSRSTPWRTSPGSTRAASRSSAPWARTTPSGPGSARWEQA
jgi:hypothetical protein